jgi:hypothetical protein
MRLGKMKMFVRRHQCEWDFVHRQASPAQSLVNGGLGEKRVGGDDDLPAGLQRLLDHRAPLWIRLGQGL